LTMSTSAAILAHPCCCRQHFFTWVPLANPGATTENEN
jgi:hypothetical protein